MDKIILGSGSPRRAEILQMAGFTFEIRKKDIEEIIAPGTDNLDAAEYLANLKADAFENELEKNEILLTADTVVILDNSILGKPKSHEDAKNMLMQLSGKTHLVTTGVCLRSNKQKVSFSDTTEVTFSTLSEDMITFYIEQYKPFDKAGAYGVQEFLGMVAVEKMNGSFYNVMGLPIHKVYQELEKFK